MKSRHALGLFACILAIACTTGCLSPNFAQPFPVCDTFNSPVQFHSGDAHVLCLPTLHNSAYSHQLSRDRHSPDNQVATTQPNARYAVYNEQSRATIAKTNTNDSEENFQLLESVDREEINQVTYEDDKITLQVTNIEFNDDKIILSVAPVKNNDDLRIDKPLHRKVIRAAAAQLCDDRLY